MRKGRVVAELTAIQKNKKVFSDLKNKIKALTVQEVSRNGEASYTTIYDYLKGKPVTAETEQHILDAVDACVKNKAKQAQERLDQAIRLVA